MRRDPQRARVLGLWTAGWLTVFLLAGVLRLGDLSVQWPLLLVPVLWALVALRPRRGRRVADDEWDDDGWHDDEWDDDGWDDDGWSAEPPPGARTDTVERPALRPRRDPPLT